MENKTYVFVAGKYHAPDGKVYKKGDKIELTDNEAKGLANQVVNPENFGFSADEIPNSNEVDALKQRIAELEQENAELREAIDEDS